MRRRTPNPTDIRALLVRQLASPVRWLDTVRALAATGVTQLIECGPGKVLTGLNKRIDRASPVQLLPRSTIPPHSMRRSRATKGHAQCSRTMLALVTGASRGIGRAIALALAGAGAQVVGTSTSAEGAAAFSELLASKGLKGRGAVLDASKADSIDALLAELDGAEGLPTILVNNAAITRDTLLLRMKPEDWDVVLDHEPDLGVPAVEGVPEAHDEGAARPHRQHHLGRRRHGQSRARRTTAAAKAGAAGIHQVAGAERWPRAASP